jgi:hypothetical protein
MLKQWTKRKSIASDWLRRNKKESAEKRREGTAQRKSAKNEHF